MPQKTRPSRMLPLLAAVLSWATAAGAQGMSDSDRLELPLWELGFGLSGRRTAEYPGADTYASRIVAFPYVAYRGRFLEIGEDDTFRFIPFRTDRLELAISVDGSSEVERRGNELSGSLPDLDALVEFGPELIWRAAEVAPVIGSRTMGRIELALQMRGAFSISQSPDYQGFLVRPALRYRQNGAIKPGSRVEMTIGPVFGTQGLQDYFYTADGTGTGTAFKARAGYMETELTASIRYPVTRRWRLIGGVRLAYLGGAANEDSPLFESRFNPSGYVGFTVSIFQSRRQALRDR